MIRDGYCFIQYFPFLYVTIASEETDLKKEFCKEENFPEVRVRAEFCPPVSYQDQILLSFHGINLETIRKERQKHG
ncbi:hypothetical protein A7K69_06510 [Parageobacillus thermoglucosidasius]|uniref:Uncharacterized protein n=1 Tax=Parageobacillus thermoglucosidasius TaxID=1426 RepID=A0A1B7KR69_PARTM|nr:hypothetical protein A7K69_06510 [Parageobacillus thermoglucosidasius]